MQVHVRHHLTGNTLEHQTKELVALIRRLVAGMEMNRVAVEFVYRIDDRAGTPDA